MDINDVSQNFNPQSIDANKRSVIDAVLESYAPLSGDQLEEMTHAEEPWLSARKNVSPSARSENLISEDIMRDFYAARIKSA